MASIGELLDGLRDQLNNDPIVSTAVSAVLSPAARTLAANFIGLLADLEAKHEADKQAAVQAAHAQGVADAQQAAPPEDSTS